MNWINLTTEAQLDQLAERSKTIPQVIYKHSTRCGTSTMVLSRLQRSTPPAGIDFYFLDLLKFRSVSDAVSERFHVHHESPQVLLISNNECVYDESHISITMDEIEEQAASLR